MVRDSQGFAETCERNFRMVKEQQVNARQKEKPASENRDKIWRYTGKEKRDQATVGDENGPYAIDILDCNKTE